MFCLIDVCLVLELNPSKVSQRLDDDVLTKCPTGRATSSSFSRGDADAADKIYEAMHRIETGATRVAIK